MDLQPVKPIGTFHAHVTRDGEARRREGAVYVLVRDLGLDANGERELEVMFEDGMWMLVREADLTPLG